MEIKCGDIFENPEGEFNHCSPCTFIVHSLDKEYWNCIQLWWYKAGMRLDHYGKPFTRLLPKELMQLKKVGNIYDVLNEKFGELTGTKKIGNDLDKR